MPRRDVRGVWISIDMEGIGGIAAHSLELVFLTSAMADMAELIPASRRSGPRAVSYASRDYLELYQAMLAMVRLAPSAVPPEQ